VKIVKKGIFKKQQDDKVPNPQKNKIQLTDSERRTIIIEDYLALCTLVAQTDLKKFAGLRPPVAVSPGEQSRTIEVKWRNRSDLIRFKMILDYCSITGANENIRAYALLYKEEFEVAVKRMGPFKEPYQFILTAPVRQWIRYKVTKLPSRRVLPQIADDIKLRKIWKLSPITNKVQRAVRRRGYNDKGSLASQESRARKSTSKEAMATQEFLRWLQELRALVYRKTSDPQKRRELYYQAVRERLNLPKNTTFEVVEDIIQKMNKQLESGL